MLGVRSRIPSRLGMQSLSPFISRFYPVLLRSKASHIDFPVVRGPFFRIELGTQGIFRRPIRNGSVLSWLNCLLRVRVIY